MIADLNRIKEWAFQWKMSFNPDPNKQAAEVIFLHKLKPPAHPAISFNNCQVASVLSHKHLCMILDSKLNLLGTGFTKSWVWNLFLTDDGIVDYVCFGK